MANVIAKSMASNMQVTLKYCFEFDGVLSDVEEANSTISILNKNTFESLKLEGKITTGMIPKISNALEAANYCETVAICGISNLTTLKNATIIKNG